MDRDEQELIVMRGRRQAILQLDQILNAKILVVGKRRVVAIIISHLECGSRCFVFSITLRFANLFHFFDDELQLVVSRVEVWRDANSGARSVVDNKLAMNQFFGDGGCVFVCYGDCSATLPGILWTDRKSVV